jgi:hypothetical protein
MPTSQPRLTEASEKRLSAALTKAADLTNSGLEPNDALVKAAEAEKIPAGQIPLMVHAYNNGRSIGHFKTHDLLSEKAAAFPLADTATVMDRLFPAQPQTVAAEKHASAVSADYAVPPEYWVARRQKQERTGMLKAASVAMPPSLKPYEDRNTRVRLGGLHQLQKQASDAHCAAVEAGYAAVRSVEAVREYVAKNASCDIDAVCENVRLVHGQKVEPLLRKLASVCQHWHSKQATSAVNWNAPPYNLIANAVAKAAAYKQAIKEYEQAEQEAVAKAAEIRRPFCQTGAHGEITGSVWDHRSRTEKAAGNFGAGLAGAILANPLGKMVDSLSPDTHEVALAKKVKAIGSPRHEANLRAIQTQTLLHDLMLGDDVISGYPPDQVLQAYNALSEVAPTAMSRRALAQSALRKQLAQGQTDMFDLDQLAKIEERLRDMRVADTALPLERKKDESKPRA